MKSVSRSVSVDFSVAVVACRPGVAEGGGCVVAVELWVEVDGGGGGGAAW
jgi:hypothetical protein